MCLALPAQIVEKDGDTAWVQLGDSRMKASLVVTPEADVGDWVLVHAGFAIQQVTEDDAKETFRIFAEMEKLAEEDDG